MHFTSAKSAREDKKGDLGAQTSLEHDMGASSLNRKTNIANYWETGCNVGSIILILTDG